MWRLVLLLPTFLIPASTYFSCSFLVSGVLDPALCFGEAGWRQSVSWGRDGLEEG